MDEQRLCRVADTGPLTLAVQNDALRHRHVCRTIHVNVADSLVVLDDGHGGLCRHSLDQGFPASRDCYVNGISSSQKMPDRFPVDGLDQLDGILRQPNVLKRRLQQSVERLIAVECFLAPTQDDGVAAHDTQSRGIRRHIGPRLVDEKDDPQRYANASHEQPVGPNAPLDDLSHRIREEGNLLQCQSDVLKTLWRQPQTIDGRLRQTESWSPVEIANVGFDQTGSSGPDRLGRAAQPVRLLIARGEDELTRCLACSPRHVLGISHKIGHASRIPLPHTVYRSRSEMSGVKPVFRRSPRPRPDRTKCIRHRTQNRVNAVRSVPFK